MQRLERSLKRQPKNRLRRNGFTWRPRDGVPNDAGGLHVWGMLPQRPEPVVEPPVATGTWTSADADDAGFFGGGDDSYVMDEARSRFQLDEGAKTARIVNGQIAEGNAIVQPQNLVREAQEATDRNWLRDSLTGEIKSFSELSSRNAANVDQSKAHDSAQQFRGNSIDWLEDYASSTGAVTEVSKGALLAAAKTPGLEILQRASALQQSRGFGVASAESLDDAVAVFKNSNGQTAQALLSSNAKYGYMIKGLGIIGTVATGVEEGAYVASVPSDKKVGAYLAAGVNVAGGVTSTYEGAIAGAYIGTLVGGPIGAGVGAFLGGTISYIGYDKWIKPLVREGYTGIQESKRKP